MHQHVKYYNYFVVGAHIKIYSCSVMYGCAVIIYDTAELEIPKL